VNGKEQHKDTQRSWRGSERGCPRQTAPLGGNQHGVQSPLGGSTESR